MFLRLRNYYQMENYTNQTVSEYVSLVNTESIFGQVSYDIKEQFFLTAAIRQDGSSTFGPSDRQHSFKKLSGAWDFTKRFTVPFVSFGKLRAAHGEAGEQPEVYSIYSGYVSDNIGYLYAFDYKKNIHQVIFQKGKTLQLHHFLTQQLKL